MIRSGNPALNDATFRVGASSRSDSMSLEGTVNKCLICIVLLLIPASYVWSSYYSGVHEFQGRVVAAPPMRLMMGGALVGFILSLVTIFKKWDDFGNFHGVREYTVI